jgi:hypothetical protein
MKHLFCDYLKDAEGNKSTGRLLALMSFFPASAVLVWTKDATIYGWYVSAYAMCYLGGKGIEMVKEMRNAPTSDDSK